MIPEIKFLMRFLKSQNPFIENIFRKELSKEERARLEGIDEQQAISTTFHPDLVPDKLDVIIVGGGIGGLVCASFLARAGKKVLVLERGEVAGGCTATFRLEGFEDYEMPIGCHYIAGATDDSIYDAIFREASLQSLDLRDFSGCFDKIFFSEENETFLVGKRDQFENALTSRFPNYKEAISSFIELCYKFLDEREEIAGFRNAPGFIKSYGAARFAPNYIRYNDVSFAQYLEDTGLDGDPLLKGILSYMCVALGVKPDEVPLPVVAVSFAVFLNGCSYPTDGPAAFAGRIGRAVKFYGGTVLCGAEVSKILVKDNDEAYGVELSDGTFLGAGTIVSSCGYLKTFRELLPPRFQSKVADYEPGRQHFLVFMGFDATPGALSFPEHNYYLARNVTHFEDRSFLDQESIDDGVPLPPVFVNFPTVLHEQGNKSVVVMAIEARYDWFKTLKDASADVYEAACEKLMQRCLDPFFAHFPKAKKHLAFAKWKTPLDMEAWIGSPSGSSFTTKMNFKRILEQTQVTPVKQLYMTGADAFLANGVTVGAISGLITARIVTNLPLISMIEKKYQFKR